MYQFSENDFLSLFEDRKKAHVNLAKMIENIPDKDTAFLSRLHYELQHNPVPDEMLNTFEQLTESVINKVSFYKMLCDFPPIIARLVKIFTSSRFLSDLIIRDFQYTYFLIRPDIDCKPLDINPLLKSIRAIMNNTTYSITRKLDQLRILKRRELLKIGIRDYILDDPLEATMRAISMLADELIRAVLELFSDSLTEKYSSPTTDFAVIALGKLGGGELNYSSDIDLMFVYSEEGQIHYNEREISHHEFYNQLCSAFIAAMVNTTREGQLYRVDARLRPDGDSGPLARCSSGFIHYYESRGQLWERQMLIKARVVAGSVEFGQKFLTQLSPFIYPKTFFSSPLKEIAKMKWRIEEQKSTDKLNIKICAGGIRDIEFILQALQLINGGRISEIQTGNTLSGLAKLFDNGLISKEENKLLAESYVLYRKIEHILQIADDRQTHSMSGERKQFTKIAYLLNYNNAEEFIRKLDSHLDSVRKIYDAVFEISDSVSHPGDTALFFRFETLNQALQIRLTQHGFESPQHTHRIIRLLNFGQFPKLHAITTQDLFVQVLPNLLAGVQLTPAPDHTIMNFERIVSAYPFPEMLYKTYLHQPKFLELTLDLCSYSHSFINVLSESPLYVDYLITHYQDWLQDGEYLPELEFSGYSNMHDFKKMEFLKLALQYSKKHNGQLCEDISRLADFILNKIFFESFDESDPVALIGLGKLGGRELSYKSDLDVVFVCDNSSDVDDLIAKAKDFLRRIMEITPRGRLYEIDARLRPEGKQAPLVVTVSRYESYFESRAMFWERQALIKSRFICGAATVKEKVSRLFIKIAYEKDFTTNEIHSIIDMRLRQTKEKIKTVSDSIHDLKFSRGGLLDIEYAIQAYQMKFGKSHHSLQTENTLQTLRLLQDLSLISGDDAQVLHQNYSFLRELEVFNYLVFERKSNKLPSDEKQLAFLSKFCKLNKDNRLLAHLSHIKKQNELLFSKLMRELEYGK
ncbi:hypothetical protein F9K33_08525 [bacterium]|nr:MAG: hypothetical protein F9K33_08525 [bacterium]